MKLKEALQKKVGEASALKENREHLDHHNRMNPEDLWEVTPPTGYNQEILVKQISDICNSVEIAYRFEGQCKATSEEIYDGLMASGSNKKSLREHYTKASKDLRSAKDKVWKNTVVCEHMTDLYDTLFADHCILCDQQLLSTSIAHLMVECEQVAGHRIQSGLVPAIQKSRLRLLGRALDPGVENVYTWLRGGVLNGEADLDQRWLDGTVEHESMGTRHDNRALAARLADSSCR
ncbi:hypothetical protein BASA60_004414 [Batrachochytrium salamandrivorans]|nr:hypothetical protein BASA60_004414 [Batrachochytrium salamandrivorans]